MLTRNVGAHFLFLTSKSCFWNALEVERAKGKFRTRKSQGILDSAIEQTARCFCVS